MVFIKSEMSKHREQ